MKGIHFSAPQKVRTRIREALLEMTTYSQGLVGRATLTTMLEQREILASWLPETATKPAENSS
jgi:hypothetical protein